MAPDCSSSGRAFAYYAYGKDCPLNFVAEVSLDGAIWRKTAALVDAISGHPSYNAGSIAIEQDGHLYAATGWTEDRQRPRNLQSRKILRVGQDGAIPAFAALVKALRHRD